jgi:hypothetical protein
MSLWSTEFLGCTLLVIKTRNNLTENLRMSDFCLVTVDTTQNAHINVKTHK